MSNRIRELTGMRFGRLLVLESCGRTNQGGVLWRCQCDCGNVLKVASGNLLHRKTKVPSCGCWKHYNAVNRESKTCARCHRNLSIQSFPENQSRSDGRSQYCKDCKGVVNSLYSGRYQSYRTAYTRQKRNDDKEFRIADNLRRRVNSMLVGKSKSVRTLELLGCTLSELVIHLENQFDQFMSWDNYGSYWHIDHILPCASFNLLDESQQRICFNYKNLQPLEAKENIRKGAKIYG